MRKPIQSEKIIVFPAPAGNPTDPHPPVAARKSSCAPQMEVVRYRIYQAWMRGVGERSLAVMHGCTREEIERVIREQVQLRRAA